MTRSFPGACLFDALPPVRTSLTRMILTDAITLKWRERDNMLMDLNGFSRLQYASFAIRLQYDHRCPTRFRRCALPPLP